jgi:hypothetical protein
MSANSSPIVVVEQKEKKPRAPTLPSKFSKFLQFGLWFLDNHLNVNPDSPAIDEALFKEKLLLFADIGEQQEFVQNFFDESKDVAKSIKKSILDRKRADAKNIKAQERAVKKAAAKAEAAAKPKVPKENVDVPHAPSDTVDNDKKARGRKKKVLTSDDAFVNEMVQIANGQEVTPLPPLEVRRTSPPPPLPRVISQPSLLTKLPAVPSSPPKTGSPKLDPLPPMDVTKETKENKTSKAAKQPKPPKEPKPTKDNKPTKGNKSSDDDQQTAVSVLNLNGEQYLIDDDQNVYHFSTHALIGKFNPKNNSIC